MKKDTILFDMDGVLINSEPQHFLAWKKVFLEYGVEIDYEGYKGCIGATLGVLSDIMRDYYKVTIPFDKNIIEKYEAYKEVVEEEEGFPEIPGVVEVVRELKEKGWRMAVASSSPQFYIERCMKILKIDDCFDLLFSGERVKNSKPAPDTFLEAAKMLGVDPAQCVVIEDSSNGVRAAKAAGMYCLGFENPGSGNQDLSPADEKFKDFRELPERLKSLY